MTEIADEHVEWAIVNRLKIMLDEPPQTSFNVTQSFALFSATLLWSKNRIWVGGNSHDRPSWFGASDHAARDARERLRDAKICASPWQLSRLPPEIIRLGGNDVSDQIQINSDFEDMAAEEFFTWLRNALAHGDGRNIRPMHKYVGLLGKRLLVGFQIVFEAQKGSSIQLSLSLYEDDMRRIGNLLADLFCKALSGGDHYFEKDAVNSIEERAA